MPPLLLLPFGLSLAVSLIAIGEGLLRVIGTPPLDLAPYQIDQLDIDGDFWDQIRRAEPAAVDAWPWDGSEG